MATIRRLTRPFKRLIRQLDINDIPPVSLLFFLGCLLLSIIAFTSWRSDRVLLLNVGPPSSTDSNPDPFLDFIPTIPLQVEHY